MRPAAPEELQACFEIRRRVFVEEQRVPEELELDALDATSSHFIALDGDRPIGTARLRTLGADAKVERVAVLSVARERGVGRVLMEQLEKEAASRGLLRVVLNAQVAVIPFYERLGYRAEGEVFDDAGIPHRRMTKALSPG